MLGKVLFIAPYKGLATLAGRLMRQQSDLDLTIRTADLADALPLLDWARGKGFDLIISRGGTASLLERNSFLPVVEIPVSGYDLFRLTSFIKNYSGQVSLIGFPNVCAGVATFSTYLNVDIPYIVVHSSDDVAVEIQRARNRGRMIIGDTVTVRLAEESGLKGMLITSGPESVRLAFEMAANLLRAMRRMRNTGAVTEHALGVLGRGIVLYGAEGNQVPLSGSSPPSRLQTQWRDRLIPFFSTCRTLPEGPYLLHSPTLSKRSERMGLLAPEANGRRFLLFFGDDVMGDRPAQLHLIRPAPVTMAQLAAGTPHLSAASALAGRLCRNFSPLAVVGEAGTGRTRVLAAIQTQLYGPGAELVAGIEIRHAAREALHRTQDLLAGTADRLAYVDRPENLKRIDQKQLARDLVACGRAVILLFRESPQRLAALGRLVPELADLVAEREIRLPSVSEDPKTFELTVLNAVIRANARYGKRVIALSPEALDALRRRTWSGNFEELSECVDQLVRDASDRTDFIVTVPPTAGSAPDVSNRNVSGFRVDLSRSLDAMEREIVAAVLAEENGNRSAAAARLGISRSTLWRMLRRPGA